MVLIGLSFSSTGFSGALLLHLKLPSIKTFDIYLDLLSEMSLVFLVLFLEAFSYRLKKVSHFDITRLRFVLGWLALKKSLYFDAT